MDATNTRKGQEMIKGWKKLARSEEAHLKENEMNNTVLFQNTIDEQAKADRNSGLFSCFECREIARTLGMEPNGGWNTDASND